MPLGEDSRVAVADDWSHADRLFWNVENGSRKKRNDLHQNSPSFTFLPMTCWWCCEGADGGNVGVPISCLIILRPALLDESVIMSFLINYSKKEKRAGMNLNIFFLPLDKWRKRVLNTQGHRYDDDIFPRDKKVIESSAREREKGHRLVSLRLLSAAMMIHWTRPWAKESLLLSIQLPSTHQSLPHRSKVAFFIFEIFHNLMMV